MKADQAEERDPTTRITHLSLEWNTQRTRREGIPKNSWRKTVEKEHEVLGTTWNQAKRAVKNSVRWKAAVEALYASVKAKRTKHFNPCLQRKVLVPLIVFFPNSPRAPRPCYTGVPSLGAVHERYNSWYNSLPSSAKQ